MNYDKKREKLIQNAEKGYKEGLRQRRDFAPLCVTMQQSISTIMRAWIHQSVVMGKMKRRSAYRTRVQQTSRPHPCVYPA